MKRGDVLFQGEVLKRSERIKMWNSRYIRIVTSDRLLLLVWSSLESANRFPEQPRGVYDISEFEFQSIQPGEIALSNTYSLSNDSNEWGDDIAAVGIAGTKMSLKKKLTLALAGSSKETSKVLRLREADPEVFTVLVDNLQDYLRGGRDQLGPLSTYKGGGRPPKREYMSRRLTVARDVTDEKRRRSLHEEYDLLEQLGQGGYATVHRAEQKGTGLIVAVKIMHAKKTQVDAHTNHSVGEDGNEATDTSTQVTGGGQGMDEMHNRQIELFEWEIRVMRKIRDELGYHPHLVKLLSICETSDPLPRTCIVMEMLNGGELFDRIVERQYYTESDAANLVKTLLQALRDLHSIGVVHRDLKPENIIFADRDSDEVKIADFGTAFLKDDVASDPFAGKLIGTPGYMAPEVIKKQPFSEACDIWSMGVIIYCLLSGKYNFDGEIWEKITPHAIDLIKRMLTVRVEERITIDEALAHPWFTTLLRRPSTLHLNATLENLKKYNRTRKFRAAAMVAMLGARLRLNRIITSNLPRQNRGSSYVSDDDDDDDN